MKILMIDAPCSGLDLCIRAQNHGHDVRLWMPRTKAGEEATVGKGLVDTVEDWEKWTDWADMIVLQGNSSYLSTLDSYFAKGYPIFGANRESAQLELDRSKGQEVFDKFGIKTIPYEVFTNYDKAIDYVKKEKRPLVSKPWGDSDRQLSFVAKDPADMVYKLEHWKEEKGSGGKFMLQEFIPGIEIAIGGWFGPGGWNRMVCENFEEKSFMNDGLGGNTGEQGTVLRYTTKSKLFDELLEPITDHLHKLKYVGYCDVNTIVNEEGEALPLEFTMRFGDPTHQIQQALHEGDPAEWMADLIEGRDTLRTSKDIALGVVMTHGDYPHGHVASWRLEGYPIRGITSRNIDNLHFMQVMDGVGPAMVGGEIEDVAMPVTAGDYVLVATGTGPTVRDARSASYRTVWGIKWASNVMFRTDIGKRLKAELPKLQELGFAKGFDY